MEKSPNDYCGLLVFDMDYVLYEGSFIDRCAERFNFRQALNLIRQIDHDPGSYILRFASFLRERTRSEFEEIINRIDFGDEAGRVTSYFKTRGYRVGVVSHSYQQVADRFAAMIGADFCYATELLWEGDKCTGEVLIPSWFHYSNESLCRHQVCKTNALIYAAKRFEMNPGEAIALGTDECDLCMLKHAGNGIAFGNAGENLRKSAKTVIMERDMLKLLSFAK